MSTIDVNNYSAVKVGLASPERIREWSYGEVLKAETINYRSQKPEPDGLFCEKIFGPSKDYECYCGKYKKIRFQGIVCEKCGVEVTTKTVRRERMGHIELGAPVSHIWYVKGISPKMGTVLNAPMKKIEEVLYYVSHIVLDPGNSDHLEKGDVLDEKVARGKFAAILKDLLETFDKESFEYSEANSMIELLEDKDEPFEFINNAYFISRYTNARFGVGAEAIKEILANMDIEKEFENIQEELKQTQGSKNQKRKKLLKRLQVISGFRESKNKPEWMILTVLPVMPPDLRPLVALDGGRLAASDLNDLYRRVISRNIRLKKLKDMNAPTVILNNEKRMLQESVDALFDNGRRSRPVVGTGNRPLKSIAHSLQGKQGRFRQHLLGKRVDYSGRSVIAVGPSLKMYECGLPKEMAVQLFRPFVIHEMMKREIVDSHKKADKLIDKMDPKVWAPLEKVIENYPVLLNRAPTLHRISIQAFVPKLVEGKAIRLHPLTCAAFNADFDGDQMAVHVPISEAAKNEAMDLMLASKNILSPKDGSPIVSPSQDMVLGLYYVLTEKTTQDFLNLKEKFLEQNEENVAKLYESYAKSNGKVFKNKEEVLSAYETKQIHLHNIIALRARSLGEEKFEKEDLDKYILTSVGKVFFNDIFPSDFPYINEISEENYEKLPTKYILDKGSNIKEIANKVIPVSPFSGGSSFSRVTEIMIDRYFLKETSKMLDKLKDIGFKFATKSGITFALSDMKDVPGKQELLDEADKAVEKINKMFQRGLLDEKERYESVIKVWQDTTSAISTLVGKQFEEDIYNPLTVTLKSGARGSIKNVAQLCGIKGPMASATGETMEIPIRSSLRDGLSVSEFFTSTHGARKGNTDKALKTAEAGYLTRRLVDVSQDIIVNEVDCGTDKGVVVKDIIDEKEDTIVATFEQRIYGRVPIRDVKDPKTKKVIASKNEMITKTIAKDIVNTGLKELEVRSLVTCNSEQGVCQKCYGLDLSEGKEVKIGTAVGVMAAQSIGERGTQLTMRTFHSGGVSGADITQGLPRIQELVEARNPKGEALISPIKGVISKIIDEDDKKEITVKNKNDEITLKTSTGNKVVVKENQEVDNGERLTAGSINTKQLLEVSDIRKVQEYIIKEIKKVYSLQGDYIADKHIEVILKQMLRKMLIVESGDAPLLPGSRVDSSEFAKINRAILLSGGRPAVGKPLLLGITKAALATESFLSSASFQETNRMLSDAVIKGKYDHLRGLKENVIIGKLIPAGTGVGFGKSINMEEKDIDEISFDDED